MFRISEKVPEVYMKESRDFQIFPRIDDLLFLGEHYDISTIPELNNPKKCRNSCLKYLAEKVGFYTDKYIPDNVLINIISAFRTALKNKGTDLGIQQAVIAILKAENSIDPPKIAYARGDDSFLYYEKYTINIYTPIKIINEVALREFLKYIIPAGYNYNIYAYDQNDGDSSATRVNTTGQLGLVTANYKALGTIRSNNFYSEEIGDSTTKATINYTSNVKLSNPVEGTTTQSNLEDRLIGTIDLGAVVGVDDLYEKDSEGNIDYSKPKPPTIDVNTKVEQE